LKAQLEVSTRSKSSSLLFAVSSVSAWVYSGTATSPATSLSTVFSSSRAQLISCETVRVHPVPGRPVEERVVPVQPPVQEVVVGMGHVAPQPTFQLELIANGRATVRQHATEQSRGGTISHDLPQKPDVLAHGLESARRVERHEAV
jgi:hypothetical protein